MVSDTRNEKCLPNQVGDFIVRCHIISETEVSIPLGYDAMSLGKSFLVFQTAVLKCQEPITE
jgi:hypothetical protein